ncbi:CU044_5270 family protein [Streptosporangium sp. G11]|uniref:CU044_5270 family protein n=1 Tax=Streptosporangium sp. G11 TaxID=3436926 RepID=UPI003EB6C6DD
MSDIDNLVKAINLAPHAPDQGPGARELREAIMATQTMMPRTSAHPHRAARRRLPWRAGAIGLGAAAAATTFFLGQVAPTATPSPTATPGGTALSGTSVLLAAAAKAEAAPQGAYWHLKQLYTHQLLWPFSENNITYSLETSALSETWMAKDGRTWIGYRELTTRPLDLEAWRRDGSPTEWAKGKDPAPPFSTSPGKAVFFQNKKKHRLYWSAMPMTLKEIEALPADPEALKKRAAEAIRRDRDFVGSVEGGLPGTLASLLYELPASPQVRSAAYKALATLPAVRVEGPTTDSRGRPGIAVTFPIQEGRPARDRLIIDPDTSKVLAVDAIGMPKGKGNGGGVVLESGWTGTKPSPPSTE